MTKFINSYQSVLEQVRSVYIDSNSQLPNHHLETYNPTYGQGFSEIYDCERMCIGRGEYWLERPIQLSANLKAHCFGITILLSGKHCLKNHTLDRVFNLDSPAIVLRKGQLGLQTIYLQEKSRMALITIDFDEDLLNLLKDSTEKNEFLNFFLEAGNSNFKICELFNKNVLHLGQYLLNLAPAHNTLDLMHLEGIALELLSLLLKNKTKQQLSPIEKAIDYVENKFTEKITIRELAKKVGINECDLKRLFKENTGLTIGNFLLQSRMQHAQVLLKQGLSVHQVAKQLGYSNVQYFKQTFQKYFEYEL